MTSKFQHFISLDEISSLHFQCIKKECQATASVPPDAWQKLPRHCPSCGEVWWYDKTLSAESVEKAVQSLQSSIKRLVYISQNQERLKGDNYLGCRLSLEIKTDGEKPQGGAERV